MELAALMQYEGELGQNNWDGAARIAALCNTFHPDEDDEQVADDPLSCYNCRYRRWTAVSMSCSKEMPLLH
jgi:hypothetical protein